ncbi:hypothetical protein FQA39_LY07851 [Lamprigera yunnana]|nr:hypothetical protein FQA39_LY07851 [Lamprigera yunnana]
MSRKNRFAFNIMAYKVFANIHINNKMSMLSRFVVYTSLAITVIHEVSLILDLLIYGLTDFQRLCEDFPMTMAFFMVAYEFYNIVTEKENLEKLLNNLERLIKECPKFAMQSYKKTVMGRAINRLDMLGLYNILFGEFCVLLWVVRPLVTNSDKLPFGNAWYPFDLQKYYYYLWFLQAYVGVLGGGNTINTHIFYAKIMAVIAEQFDILSHSFRRIDTNIANEEKDILSRVKCCIRFHQQLINHHRMWMRMIKIGSERGHSSYKECKQFFIALKENPQRNST